MIQCYWQKTLLYIKMPSVFWGTRRYKCALHFQRVRADLSRIPGSNRVRAKVRGVAYWFALQRRVCNAAENKGCSYGSKSDTRLCVRPLHTKMPVFITSVCGKCAALKNAAHTSPWNSHWHAHHTYTHIHSHTKKQIAHTRAHTPPFFLLYSNILIFQSGTVASSLCTTVIICLPFFFLFTPTAQKCSVSYRKMALTGVLVGGLIDQQGQSPPRPPHLCPACLDFDYHLLHHSGRSSVYSALSSSQAHTQPRWHKHI